MNRFDALERDCRGATATEFALLAPVLILFLVGFLDFGNWIYVRSTAIGALENGARSAGVGGSGVDPATFEAAVEAQVRKVAPSATFTWSVRSYYQFSGIGKPEKLITDRNANGQYDSGDCWEDLNPNGTYDVNPGRDGVGGADDIVFYQLTLTFPALVPLGGFIPGMSSNNTSVINTINRRQPFAAQAVPAIRC